jgi:hypothetical protein
LYTLEEKNTYENTIFGNNSMKLLLNSDFRVDLNADRNTELWTAIYLQFF